MRILVAPDKFRDAISAEDAAEAIAAGVLQVLPAASIDLCPLADGGEGTGPILARAFGAAPRIERVHDPIMRNIDATWWWNPARKLAIIEMAEASGLRLLKSDERNPTHTTSFGTGELIAAAMRDGAHDILLAAGGSATVDGGAGCLQALGYQLIDATVRPIPPGLAGGGLQRVATARGPLTRENARITVLADVDNPLLGPAGAAPTFGPQKGATPADVALLETGLAHWAAVLNRMAAVERFGPLTARFGAAGGIGAALAAAFVATLRSAFDVVAEAVDLPGRLRRCDLCITGEGRLDSTSQRGKVTGGVVRVAQSATKPVVALVGSIGDLGGMQLPEWASRAGFAAAIPITAPGVPLPDALRDTATGLKNAAESYLRKLGRRASAVDSGL